MMIDALLWIAAMGTLAVIGLLLFLIVRTRSGEVDQLQTIMRDEFRFAREEAGKSARELRDELRSIGQVQQQSLETIRNAVDARLREIHEAQQAHWGQLHQTLHTLQNDFQTQQEKVRHVLDAKLQQLQDSNERKLEEMRLTVDEKLQKTLQSRLSESFQLVEKRLEYVHKALGEMQALAADVGDLKRVLTNVKERGTWGEYQLQAILEQVLTPEQYAKNVGIGRGRETVEFAIKLPGRDKDGAPVWLPIDAKFPKEAYERLTEAAARGDQKAVEDAHKELVRFVKDKAKEISEKYIVPPQTTDFAIMFLATEGLYAEVLREPGLATEIQRAHHVIVTGPTTMAALLNSLRVGFATLAIEKRTAEVWEILRQARAEHEKFGKVLQEAKKTVDRAADLLSETSRASERVRRTLVMVEREPTAALPMSQNADADSLSAP